MARLGPGGSGVAEEAVTNRPLLWSASKPEPACEMSLAITASTALRWSFSRAAASRRAGSGSSFGGEGEDEGAGAAVRGGERDDVFGGFELEGEAVFATEFGGGEGAGTEVGYRGGSDDHCGFGEVLEDGGGHFGGGFGGDDLAAGRSGEV